MTERYLVRVTPEGGEEGWRRGSPLAFLLAWGALGGAVGAGGLTRFGWNAVYRSVLRGLERSLEKTLTHVERDLERGAALRPLPGK